MHIIQHEVVSSHSSVPLLSPASSTETSESSPSRRRKRVAFSNIDVIVLPYTHISVGFPSFLPTIELAWEPSDRFSITVDSLEETRSLVYRFCDDKSPLDRFTLIRNLRLRDYPNSPPLVIDDTKKSRTKKSMKEDFEDHQNSVNTRNPIMLWSLVLLFSYIAFSAPYQVCHPYPSHQALKKVLRLGTMQGSEAEVTKRKRMWNNFWKEPSMLQ